MEMSVSIKVTTYEESRLAFFKECLKKAQRRVKRLAKTGFAAPYGSDEWIKFNEAVDIRNYYQDAVRIIEAVDDFCQKAASRV